jgi:DNA-binding MarR family transcriptional regulator
MDRDPWLSDAQQQVWRQWLELGHRLPAALNRGLQAGSELSLPDFDVLVALSETDADRLRVSELAAALGWERSRLSHHLNRMQARDLVAREECADDGRGAFAVLTDTGRATIRQAAPDHAGHVRDLVFDHLTDAELRTLGRVLTGVLARLDSAG